MNNLTMGYIVGVIARYVFGIALVLLSGYFLLWLAEPVFEKIGESISGISSALNIGRGDDFHSIAVLCILFIGIIGLAKVLTRRK